MHYGSINVEGRKFAQCLKSAEQFPKNLMVWECVAAVGHKAMCILKHSVIGQICWRRSLLLHLKIFQMTNLLFFSKTLNASCHVSNSVKLWFQIEAKHDSAWLACNLSRLKYYWKCLAYNEKPVIKTITCQHWWFKSKTVKLLNWNCSGCMSCESRNQVTRLPNRT